MMKAFLAKNKLSVSIQGFWKQINNTKMHSVLAVFGSYYKKVSRFLFLYDLCCFIYWVYVSFANFVFKVIIMQFRRVNIIYYTVLQV